MKHSTVIRWMILAGIGLCAMILSAHAQLFDQGEGTAQTPLIVIDPGHGGGNTGAPTVEAHIREKHVTLPLARLLKTRLENAGYRVILTREQDVYLTLRQRVAHANKVRADVFISLHANATETHAQRGHETFILSLRGIDVDARALRIDDGVDRPELPVEVAFVLDDIERGLAQSVAADLASRIQARMHKARPTSDDRGVRQEVMHVLLGATMPAVLVEVGFVDHAIEGPELLDSVVREQICEALAGAIEETVPLDPAE